MAAKKPQPDRKSPPQPPAPVPTPDAQGPSAPAAASGGVALPDVAAAIDDTRRVRFLTSISGHDLNAAPGDVLTLPIAQATAFADGVRAELVED